MTCAEFQRVLPYIIETGGNAEEEEHLQECKVCSDLVADLRYIAEQAKLLVPMEDPNPRVWTGIQQSLEREGLVKGKLSRSVTTLRVSALVAVAIMATVVLSRNNTAPAPATEATVADATEPGDAQILQTVSAREPGLRATYEDNLKEVNQYIRDARQRVDRDPGDDAAQRHLQHAYHQKAVLYQVALSQSLQ